MKHIEAEDLERAERMLSNRAAATVTPAQINAAVAERAGLTADLVAGFVETHYSKAKTKYFPGVDPRIEQYIVVLMRHSLLVGALASQISRGEAQ